MKYKGTTLKSISGFYSPYIPLQMSRGKRDSWQSFLRRQHLNNANVEEVETLMQLSFPGPYVIEEYFDTTSMSFNYRPKFEDPKQETMWRIKYE